MDMVFVNLNLPQTAGYFSSTQSTLSDVVEDLMFRNLFDWDDLCIYFYDVSCQH